MRILITGGTGFIGQALCRRLHELGHHLLVVSRHPDKAAARLPAGTRVASEVDALAEARPEALVNLAGEPIFGRRWSHAQKRRLVESRTAVTAALVALCGRLDPPPKVLVSASAMGWYGDQGDRVVDEFTAPAPSYEHDLCAAWEAEAQRAAALGTRVAIARIGLVLDRDGGLLARMLPAFRLGLGGRLGDGRQYMPWIHRRDLVRALIFVLDNDRLDGPFNMAAPHPVRNADFAAALARKLGRPAWLAMPAPLLNLMFGEMARLMLTGADMRPKRLLEAGFEFDFPQLEAALDQILSNG
ncbi:MAG: TIGR01777 family oxidoreductase [Wenzhouxiangellaceae bacterium]